MWTLAALIGAALAIVINVLADALPPDERGTRQPFPAPVCRVCGRPYPPLHWLAVLHGLRGGRCANCYTRRGWRAPAVEVVMAAGSVFLWQWSAGDIGKFYASVAVAFIFLLITLIDIEHRLILWRTVWVSALVLLTIGVTTLGWQKTLLGGVVGYVIVFVLFLVGQLYEWLVARWRGRPLDEIAFGGGDVNLAALVGLAVGWTGVLFALLIGIVTAGLYSLGFLGWQLARGRYSPHAAFPYGPFLVLGAMVMYLYGRELAGWWLGR